MSKSVLCFFSNSFIISGVKCALAKEWIKKMMYIYSGILFNHKKNKVGSFIKMWMNLESVIQREISQKEKNK